MPGIHNKSTSSADTSVENYSIILPSCIVLRKGGGLKFPLCVDEVAWAY